MTMFNFRPQVEPPSNKHMQGPPIKTTPLEKKFHISANVGQIWAKFSVFTCEYSHNMFCKFHWYNWHRSTNTAV